MGTEIEVPRTQILNEDVDVFARLADLRVWQQAVEDRDARLAERVNELELERKQYTLRTTLRMIDQKQSVIGILRRRSRVLIAKIPFELSDESLAFAPIFNSLSCQYAGLSKVERLLWLNNLHFIMTPDVRTLNAKLSRIMQRTLQGEQRNLLIGGDSGSGKTRFMDWRSAQHLPVVEAERNYVPVIQVEAIKNDKTTRSLLQQMVLACGENYLEDDSVHHLFNKIGALFQVCGVKIAMVDELNHLTDITQRRRLLEISNKTVSTSIVGAAVDPLKFRDGSPEIQGRFIDYYPLPRYTGERLSSLLLMIELILPFSERSFLANRTITKRDGKMEVEQEGIASFIERKTKGSFRYIMHLIRDATELAIEQDLPSLPLGLLENTWKMIQSSEFDDFA